MFEKYHDLVVKKHIDSVREKLGLDSKSKCGRAIETTDGGMTQLQAYLTKESLEDLDERNILYAKLCRNTSGVFQPADTGDGHMLMRGNVRKLSRQPIPSLNCGDGFDRAMAIITDKGLVDFDSATLSEIRALVVRTPKAIAMSYSESSVMRSFTRPGWRDEETMQGPDTIRMFGSLKRAYTVEERQKWEGYSSSSASHA